MEVISRVLQICKRLEQSEPSKSDTYGFGLDLWDLFADVQQSACRPISLDVNQIAGIWRGEVH